MRLGVIVDGAGDYASIRARFSRARVLKTDGPRGKDADIIRIVQASAKQIRMLSEWRCGKVVVVIDREGRDMSRAQLVEALRREYARQYRGVLIEVAVPDRMMENWYLADIEKLSRTKNFLKDRLRQKRYEGTNGKKELKRCFVPTVAYVETKHGPQLFGALRFAVARQNSSSFDAFMAVMAR